ncbi:isoprenoid synthase domain-containing protein [Thelonectria olida]|uniref:Terpene synthase n=1 Tax=Thelonectria olida TaxID=1576542 RepID=A0A9P8WI88_9HYPO|nr:isoprenoid synthase domain-containing protein [Thelonectria olida]
MKPVHIDQDAIITALKGQTLRVPDLTSFFPTTWAPARLHPHHAALVPLVDAAIDRMAAAHQPVARRKRDDLAGLVGRWFPQATDAAIETLALFTVWLVCWDDAVDAGEGDLASDFERAEGLRSSTLEVIRGALGIDGAARDKNVNADVVNAVFQEFADGFGPSCPADQRRRFYEELKYFIDSCGVEQKLRLERTVPAYDSYMALRLGTVGGSILCSLVEYATQEPLPDAVVLAPQVRRLWTQVSILLAILNDVLSLKKELGTDCIINAVTALMEPGKGLDEVMGELERKMKQAVEDFDGAAEELLAQTRNDEALSGVVRRYIDGCRATVTGTLEFTLRSPRYQIAKLRREDGSLEIVL